VLADPRVPREPFDEFKYIPLSDTDRYTYLSFGADTRERFESNDAANFGTGPNRSQNYVISRNEFDADLRIANQIQAFVQFQVDYAPWKTMLTPVDADKLDLEQAFVVLTEPVGGGTLKLRAGRQQFAFDLQRFVSVRDGPNVRQSYDAGWADYENGPWRFITLYSLPVQVRDVTIFDDYSSVTKRTFGMARTEYKFSESLFIAGYYANFTQANAQFANASGDQRRDTCGLHRVRQPHSHQAIPDADPDFVAESHDRRSGSMASNHGRRRLHPARCSRAEDRWPAWRIYRQLRTGSARLDHRPRDFIRRRGRPFQDRRCSAQCGRSRFELPRRRDQARMVGSSERISHSRNRLLCPEP
jgi:hypothetical protein